jgi:hypothetical protein
MMRGHETATIINEIAHLVTFLLRVAHEKRVKKNIKKRAK